MGEVRTSDPGVLGSRVLGVCFATCPATKSTPPTHAAGPGSPERTGTEYVRSRGVTPQCSSIEIFLFSSFLLQRDSQRNWVSSGCRAHSAGCGLVG